MACIGRMANGQHPVLLVYVLTAYDSTTTLDGAAPADELHDAREKLLQNYVTELTRFAPMGWAALDLPTIETIASSSCTTIRQDKGCLFLRVRQGLSHSTQRHGPILALLGHACRTFDKYLVRACLQERIVS